MTVMDALKYATKDVHIRLEKRLAVKDRFSELALYLDYIANLWAFYAAAEAEWAALLEPVLKDFPARRKAALLANDLQAVGGTPGSFAVIPAITDTASALGGFYVLEGATLGGQHLLPIAERKLGLSSEKGASYLASYGSQVLEMWQTYGAAVESYCQTPESAEHAVAAALATFLSMEECLCGAPA